MRGKFLLLILRLVAEFIRVAKVRRWPYPSWIVPRPNACSGLIKSLLFNVTVLTFASRPDMPCAQGTHAFYPLSIDFLLLPSRAMSNTDVSAACYTPCCVGRSRIFCVPRSDAMPRASAFRVPIASPSRSNAAYRVQRGRRPLREDHRRRIPTGAMSVSLRHLRAFSPPIPCR